MIDKKFRRLMIDSPNTVLASVLSPKQIEIAKIIHDSDQPIYSRDISDKLCISVQNASTQLSRLVKAGYATRREVVSESGGIEYQLTTLN